MSLIGIILAALVYYFITSNHKKKQETVLVKFCTVGYLGWKLNFPTYESDDAEVDGKLDGVFYKKIETAHLIRNKDNKEIRLDIFILIEKTSGGYKQKYVLKIDGQLVSVTEQLIKDLKNNYSHKEATSMLIFLDGLINYEWRDVKFSEEHYYMLELFDVMLKIYQEPAGSHFISELRKYKKM